MPAALDTKQAIQTSLAGFASQPLADAALSLLSSLGYHCINSVNVAILKQEYVSQIQYFVGLLNSSLLNFYYREISQEAGRVLAEVKPQRIRGLPIANTDEHQRSAIVKRVDKILAAKRRDPEADTSGLERDHRKRHGTGIDAAVYKLYGLTPDEVKLVEESHQR